MTLKELKKMIAEEYAAYKKTLSEQMPGGMPELPGVAVSDADVDATGGGGDAEKTLKTIFDMLQDYFDAEDADETDPAAAADVENEAGDDDADDADDDKDEDEIEETAGSNAGYKKVKESKNSKKALIEAANRIKNNRNRLSESKRLQKLANIIK
jgi:hypothetical protein